MEYRIVKSLKEIKHSYGAFNECPICSEDISMWAFSKLKWVDNGNKSIGFCSSKCRTKFLKDSEK